MTRVRCFTGIPLPVQISGPLVEACEAVRETDPSWRDEKWVPPQNLHVTLKFIGWLDEEVLDDLCSAVGGAVERRASFDLPFEGVVAVPTTRRCRMLWGSFLDPNGCCTALAEAIEEAVLAFGVEPERRAFRAHATLVRARRPKPMGEGALDAAARLIASAPGFMSVPSASLFTSRLTPHGPIYDQIGAWPLEGE